MQTGAPLYNKDKIKKKKKKKKRPPDLEKFGWMDAKQAIFFIWPNVYFVCIDVAHIHACIYVCLNVCMQTVQPSRFRQDYPDLKILNPNQCVIRIGKIPISTRVVIFLSNSHKKKTKCRKL